MSKSAIMSRVLVAYATRMDSTREIAVAIADELRRLGHQVTVTPCPTSVSLAKFDAVLVGSAVYGRRWLPEAVQFLAARQDSLQDRMVWLFQSGSVRYGSRSCVPHRAARKVRRLASTIGTEHITFKGRLAAERARTWVARWLGRGGLAGDYRDGDAIRSWARAVSGQLEACHRPTDPAVQFDRHADVTAQLHSAHDPRRTAPARLGSTDELTS